MNITPDALEVIRPFVPWFYMEWVSCHETVEDVTRMACHDGLIKFASAFVPEACQAYIADIAPFFCGI